MPLSLVGPRLWVEARDGTGTSAGHPAAQWLRVAGAQDVLLMAAAPISAVS